MAENRDERSTDDDAEPTDVQRSPAPAGDSTEPLVSDDPLGLGGAVDPDAPSRSENPRSLSLLREFFTMSRTSAILLAAFVLLGALYMLVRAEPVVSLNRTPPAASEQTGSETTSPTEGTTTEETSATTSPTEATSPTQVSPTEATSATETPSGQRNEDETTGATPPSAVPTGSPPAGEPSQPAGQAAPTGATGGTAGGAEQPTE